MSKKCFVVLLLIFSGKTEAYIPSYSLILSHLAYFQGKGGYRIEQELFFKGARPFSLKEIWWIKDPNYIRLDVKSAQKEKLYFRFIYEKNKKWFKDEKGRLKNQLISYYHLERPFHLRSARELGKLFSFWKVAPFPPAERKPGVGFEPFLRLSRKGGVIQYETGLGKARVWVEQDEFVIRSWKWSTGETLMAWNYRLYPGHFFFPSKRLFTQNATETEIQVKKVQSLKLTKKTFRKTQLLPNVLDPELTSIVQERMREFYGKFR